MKKKILAVTVDGQTGNLKCWALGRLLGVGVGGAVPLAHRQDVKMTWHMDFGAIPRFQTLLCFSWVPWSLTGPSASLRFPPCQVMSQYLLPRMGDDSRKAGFLQLGPLDNWAGSFSGGAVLGPAGCLASS